MRSAAELLISVSILFGAGVLGLHAVKRIEGAAKLQIQKGLPPLSPFTEKLTCVSYDNRTGLARASHARYCRK